MVVTMLYYPIYRKLGYEFDELHDVIEQDIAKHYRCCPNCLSDDKYNKRLWQIKTLTGCATHHCRLLEACPQCQCVIDDLPLVRIDTCPQCEYDLKQAITELLPKPERVRNTQRMEQVSYLLETHHCEAEMPQLHPHLVAETGQNLYNRQVSLSQFLHIMEANNTHPADIFHRAYQALLQTYDLYVVSKHEQNQMKLLSEILTIIPQVVYAGDFPTSEQIAYRLDRKVCGMARYQQIKYLFKEIYAESSHTSCIQFMYRLERTMHSLMREGISPTQQNMAAAMGIAASTICQRAKRDESGRIAEIVKVSKGHVKHFRLALYHRREQEEVRRVLQAIRELQAVGSTVNNLRIERHLNTSFSAMRYYEKVSQIMDIVLKCVKSCQEVDVDRLSEQFLSKSDEKI
ncbi:MAG: TniQ family protein [Chloroflexota bacterium]